MKVFVLISTIDQGITKVPAVLLPREEDVQYVVCWQRTEKGRLPDGGPSGSIPGTLREEEKAMELLSEREDVTFTTMDGAGLCRSRNRAIQTALSLMTDALEDAILILADDDERFEAGAFELVRDVYRARPRLDVALLRMLNEADGLPFKRYPEDIIDYKNRPRYYYPSSLEMTMRSRVVLSGLCFDERFGLGSAKLSGGEEDVFLGEAVKKGLCVKVFPVNLCRTNAATTGRRNVLDVKALRSKGAVYGRLLPLWRAFLRSAHEALSLSLRTHRPFTPIFENIWFGVKYIRS